jgi:hypothetical protein
MKEAREARAKTERKEEKIDKTFLHMRLYTFRVCDRGDSLALQSGRPSTSPFLSRGLFPLENEKPSTSGSLSPTFTQHITYSCSEGNVSAS